MAYVYARYKEASVCSIPRDFLNYYHCSRNMATKDYHLQVLCLLNLKLNFGLVPETKS